MRKTLANLLKRKMQNKNINDQENKMLTNKILDPVQVYIQFGV